jgi:hypothetical protein
MLTVNDIDDPTVDSAKRQIYGCDDVIGEIRHAL